MADITPRGAPMDTQVFSSILPLVVTPSPPSAEMTELGPSEKLMIDSSGFCLATLCRNKSVLMRQGVVGLTAYHSSIIV